VPLDEPIPLNKYCWITGNTVNVRKGPTTNSEVVAKVHRADRAVFLCEEGDWVMITWSNGDTVYVHKSLVSFDEIIKEGSSFLSRSDAIALFERRIRKKEPYIDLEFGLEVIDVHHVTTTDGFIFCRGTAVLEVTDKWYKASGYQKKRFAKAMFNIWIDCLIDTGNEGIGNIGLTIVDRYYNKYTRKEMPRSVAIVKDGIVEIKR